MNYVEIILYFQSCVKGEFRAEQDFCKNTGYPTGYPVWNRLVAKGEGIFCCALVVRHLLQIADAVEQMLGSDDVLSTAKLAENKLPVHHYA